MDLTRLLGSFGRSRATAAERRRLAIEIREGPDPRAGAWYMIGDLGHLYLNRSGDEPPVARPVCGVAPVDGARSMDVNAGDDVCPDCDAYLHDRYLVQVG